METEATRTLMRKFLEARAANDAATIAELVTDDVEWRLPASAGMGPFVGRDVVVPAITGGASGTFLDVSTLRRDVRSLIVDGDRAVVQQRVTAKALNGNDYANEYCWAYTCRDGRVAVMEEYADSLYAARVFGQVEG